MLCGSGWLRLAARRLSLSRFFCSRFLWVVDFKFLPCDFSRFLFDFWNPRVFLNIFLSFHCRFCRNFIKMPPKTTLTSLSNAAPRQKFFHLLSLRPPAREPQLRRSRPHESQDPLRKIRSQSPDPVRKVQTKIKQAIVYQCLIRGGWFGCFSWSNPRPKPNLKIYAVNSTFEAYKLRANIS